MLYQDDHSLAPRTELARPKGTVAWYYQSWCSELLAVKANDEAWKKAQNLGETAREEYIKAVAANRVDAYLKAVDPLERAFELDQSLREIARVDGDLTDLMEDFDQQ